MLRHYGVDLLDWHRGHLSSRRLRVLTEHLPADSSFARAVHGEQADWTVTDHLLAAVVDHLAVANWMFATANRDEDTEPAPYPEPVPRPGGPDSAAGASAAGLSAAGEERSATAAEIVAFLGSP
ncbi:hypothetical protein QQY66_09555 [Streptomyces sp. DG2A-72]|uniref:hypothetical protein n=1 Tax=Streptomyces sp. DG2A-72 TaxID=3051386 RepID=UPI00265C4427|nr:hypothetical protein [Streptomyces sp. DG2A-72]MDO0931918.1 hypothetical protein [Streptomyces sp. DG2A-72]